MGLGGGCRGRLGGFIGQKLELWGNTVSIHRSVPPKPQSCKYQQVPCWPVYQYQYVNLPVQSCSAHLKIWGYQSFNNASANIVLWLHQRHLGSGIPLKMTLFKP